MITSSERAGDRSRKSVNYDCGQTANERISMQDMGSNGPRDVIRAMNHHATCHQQPELRQKIKNISHNSAPNMLVVRMLGK